MKIAVIPVTPLQQNCCLIWDEESKRGAVVDPGGDVDRLMEEITRLGVTVEKILLTHGHVDHAAGAAELQTRLRAGRIEEDLPIEGPDRRDQFLLENLAAQAAKFGIADARNVTPDRWLVEGDTVSIAETAFEVLHCPGHTPGHIVFVNRAGRFAVVGDVLFRGSVGRTDFPYGDHAALITAIREKLLPLGDDIAFLCGHGPGSTLGRERRANMFLQD